MQMTLVQPTNMLTRFASSFQIRAHQFLYTRKFHTLRHATNRRNFLVYKKDRTKAYTRGGVPLHELFAQSLSKQTASAY